MNRILAGIRHPTKKRAGPQVATAVSPKFDADLITSTILVF
jgi:hypothetical protein